MKKFLSLLPVAALALLLPTSALAQYSSVVILNGGTNNVGAAASTNSTYASVSQTAASFNVPNHATLPVQVSFKLAGSGTTAVVFKFDESIDGSVWVANAYSISVTANGTNVVANTGKFTLDGMPYLRLQTIEQPNATALTNLTLTIIKKSGPSR
jgi:hypothetical protein